MQVSTSKLVPFYGNGPYCYSNSTSMLLASVGESIPPSDVEVYTGVGLGAFMIPSEKLLFFSNLANPPDKGITRALSTLGFEFKETSTEKPGTPPYDKLESDLKSSPAILGPLDMGYLMHNPLHKRMMGADHFVVAYGADNDGLLMHDPEGFPNVRASFSQFEPAWRAEKVGYRRGYYRYWTSPRRIRHPNTQQLYDTALKSFRDIYREGDKLSSNMKWPIDQEAIQMQAKRVMDDKVSPGERGFMTFFAFKLGARRALGFANFFANRHPRLAELKTRQAELFGKSQSQAVDRKWRGLADSLNLLAETEKEFKETLLSS
jgi:hypothetical protein